MKTEKMDDSGREKGCWNFNVAEGYLTALQSCKELLKEAVVYLERDANAVNAEKSMKRAQLYMDEATRWFNRANNQMFRLKALVDEVKMQRQGIPVSYPEGADPADWDWARDQQ